MSTVRGHAVLRPAGRTRALAGILLLAAGLCAAVPAAPAQPAARSAEVPGTEPEARRSPLDGLIKHRESDGDERFLPVDDAFRVEAVLGPTGRAELRFAVAKGYYLYRDRLRIAAADADTVLGTPELPTGVTHEDSYFGPQQIYPEAFVISVPVTRGSPPTIKVVYQGCAEAGLCYPPQTRVLTVGRGLAGSAGAANPAGDGGSGGGIGGGGHSEQDKLASLLAHGRLWSVLGVFFVAGLLLAFTPCVLPMIPILSGIIAGDGPATTPLRSFMLSVSYVLGMAVTYTLAGAASALLGAQVQAVFQKPWIVVLFAGLFVALAASMFGFYELQMPASLQTRFASASGRFRGGKFLSTALIGALSSLVVTACVAPPLVAALTVIAETGQIARSLLWRSAWARRCSWSAPRADACCPKPARGW